MSVPGGSKVLDENGEWLIRHLRCEWGIRTPEECNQINDPCVPCALRLWLDDVPALSEEARRAIAAADVREGRNDRVQSSGGHS